MTQNLPATWVYYVTTAVMLVLLGLSILANQFHLGPFGPVIALGVAGAQAILIGLFLMHLKYSHPLMRAFATIGLLWLLILMGLVISDYIARGYPSPAAPSELRAEGAY